MCEFYRGTDVADSRIIDPSGVHCVVWNNLINILIVNTALISDGQKHNQILNINALSQYQIDFTLPSIMLGHHGIDSLYPCYAERVKSIIDRRKISAYLHGDSHQYMNHPISKISTPNCTLPNITCAKSAPQSGDSYSDIGVVYYEWRNDDNTYVQAYRWTQNGFVEDSTYYYKRYYFPMIYEKDDIVNKTQTLYEQIKNMINDHSIFMAGEWLKEAKAIWNASGHEGIGRCLLIFYSEKAFNGIVSAHQQAQEIHRALSQIPKHDADTQTLLELTRKLIHSGE